MGIVAFVQNFHPQEVELALGGIPDSTLDAAKALIIKYLKEKYPDQDFNPKSIVVECFRYVLWNDSSLGCPEEGKFYEQVLTPGYQVQLSISPSNELFIVHTNANGSLCLLT